MGSISFLKGKLSMAEGSTLQKRYQACMILSGAGDALGYNNGDWEFESNAEKIHKEVAEKGGLAKLDIRNFPISDDTVMHLATADALVKTGGASLKDLYGALVKEYIKCMDDMSGRAPGFTCISSTTYLRGHPEGNWRIPFSKVGGGCGAAMRAMCVGLRFPAPEQENHLVAVSVESGRMTHHHPTGYLGGLAGALFTAYAVRGEPPVEAWGQGLMEVLKRAKEYVKQTGHCVEENLEHWNYFEDSWRIYLGQRGILEGTGKAQFPDDYGVPAREVFYKSVSHRGTGGASGHDAPMIAYDALLRAGDSWTELANHGFFHGGDSDSTAAIAAAWWGALYGFHNVPSKNYKGLEYYKRLSNVADALYQLRDKPLS
ncbi:protein ADP-ribosylarginine hydrolase isoform X2 [Clupea harengus]|uniref:ADP-ribosylhydrolase ARH1 n=1 Tax=Clupea harengus TaxID=7950 RepID=A0A6P8GNT9_CLUHA|nr:protein ADP-ribosylarginine hydrolase isoform X2 [Clupea harengus]